MEYRIKVDPARQLKVFDAVQVIEAIDDTATKVINDLEKKKNEIISKRGADPDGMNGISTSLMILAITMVMKEELTKKLGLNGTAAIYIDGE